MRAARPEEYGWIIERTGLLPTSNTGVLCAVDDSGRIVGQFAGQGWTPNSVIVAIAVDEPIALRPLLSEAFRWVFVQAKRGVAFATILATNERSIRLCKRLGFREVCRVENGHAVGVDMVLMQLRREWWRASSLERKAA